MSKINEFLPPGATIVTESDSGAIILLTNGTVITLAADTTLKLGALATSRFEARPTNLAELESEPSSSRTRLDLKVGELVVDVKTLSQSSSFEITTASGVAGIRGTAFKLLSLEDSTSLFVLNGRVDFVSSSKKEFQVAASQRIFAKKGEDPKIAPLSEVEKKSIAETVAKARQKADEVSLSTLSEGLSALDPASLNIQGWTTEGNWLVEKDGSLFLKPGPDDKKAKGFKHYLWSEKSHEDFELSFDYKYGKGHVGAVIFRAADKQNPSKYYQVPIGDTVEQGGLSWVIKPAKDASKGPDEWNRLFISAKGGNVTVDLNGEKVVDVGIRPFPRRSINNLSDEDNQRIPRQDRNSRGWVAITNKGDPMRFRNLSITNFKNGVALTRIVPSAKDLEMIWVEPGTFTMGSPTSEARRGSDETEHNVTLTKGFYLGKYEVTQAQYEAVMTGNTNSLSPTPSKFFGENRPVEQVSWGHAKIFLNRLNAAEQAAGRLPAGWQYVLPTEAQWEYACRAGTTTVYSWGNDINSTRANYDASGIRQTSDVGQYAANPWGFYDMHGNIWEWVADWRGAYPDGPLIDPTGPASGSHRVRRGGSWNGTRASLRSATRLGKLPSYRYYSIGFRVGLKASQ